MRVLLVNGSPRREGNTNTALKEIAAQIQKHGIESEIIWIGTKSVRGCIACNKCKENGNLRCQFDDDVTNQVIAKMAECDALVMGSPVYFGQPSGQTLCLQQRMLYAGRANFEHKPVAAVAICRRGGASAVYQTLLMPFQMVNMPIVTSQYWNIAYGQTPGQVSEDAEGLQTMRTLADNMAWMLKKFHGVETTETPEHEEKVYTNFIR